MFLHLSVILFTDGVVSGRHPPGQTPPWADTSLGRHPLGRYLPGHTPPWETPLGRYPLGRHPPRQTPGQTPLRRRPLQRTVRIILECIYVIICKLYHIFFIVKPFHVKWRWMCCFLNLSWIYSVLFCFLHVAQLILWLNIYKTHSQFLYLTSLRCGDPQFNGLDLIPVNTGVLMLWMVWL